MSTKGRWLAAAAMLATLAGASPAGAQELRAPAARQGYFLSFGAYGVLDANWDEERWYKGWPGFSGNLRVGQGLFEWLDLGLSIDFGYATGAARQATFGGISAEAQFHPIADLAIRVGTGFGVLSAEEKEAEPSDELTGGIGATFNLGVSYDWFPLHEGDSGGWAVSPVVQVRLMPREELSAVTFWAGLEVTWWLGLPRNQLDLPVDEAFAP